MSIKRQRFGLGIALSPFLAAAAALCMAQEPSPKALVEKLTFVRPDADPFISINVCPSPQELAENRDSRIAAMSLVTIGSASIPEIQKQLNLIERGVSVRNTWLLLHVFAKIRGPAAAPELSKLRNSTYVYAVADSMALALDITGYVFDTQLLPTVSTHYCRTPLPRDALNLFILAWEKNDSAWITAHVGPRAAASINAMLLGRSWRAIRTELWGENPSRGIAVGYSLAGNSVWSAPEDTLDGARVQYYLPAAPIDPNINAIFKDKAGRDCGQHQISFLGRGSDQYIVDEPDMEGLLRVIATCAHD